MKEAGGVIRRVHGKKDNMRRVILNKGEQFSNKHLKRTGAFNARAMEAATNIIQQVREQGDAALRELTERFDGVAIENFRVPAEAIEAAAAKVDPKTEEALKKAAKQIREFHERQVKQSWFSVREDGALVGAKVTPLESVGIYVPGGRALYPSTVLMNALPAAVGGAQAVAALAYGTETIEPVCKITGPGNAFVAAAKKIVSGDVGIDMIAGPSEVCVVADETADPAMVAIDLMAQAEHDPLASCYLVTFDEGYADKVEAAIEGHMKASTRAEITTASLADQGLVVICDSMEQAIQSVNVIAPEHLELHFDGAFEQLGAIRNAGAIFVGEWTPEAVGDYVAGPNHTLPTGGTARYASPLSTDEFVKHSSVIQYSAKSLANDADAVIAIARHEGLWAHARSVELRKALVETGDIYGLDGADE